MLTSLPLLSSLIGTPCLGALLILLTCCNNTARAKTIAVSTMLVSLLLALLLSLGFDSSQVGMQFVESYDWIKPLNIRYSLGVDGLALVLIVLSNFTSFVVVLAGCNSIQAKVKSYMVSFLLMQSIMVGVFAATDAILYFIFWEMTLIPIYLAIGIWGSDGRLYASMKFFLYTFAGSAMMLIGLLFLGLQAQGFHIADFYQLPLSANAQTYLFLAFFLGFAVKIPMWPVHTWLPDAHTEAPAGGSVILAALMLKMGAYGFLRFSLPILPDASRALAGVMVTLSLIAVIYIGLVAIIQKDMKRLIAYSSISHMGFVTLGCFVIYLIDKQSGNVAGSYLALEGAIVQMISHGFSSGALFVAIGMLYDRMHTRNINDFGGVAYRMPVFAALFMLFAMTNAGLPGTSGFVGEFMVILGSYQASFWIAFAAAMTLLLAAAYTLWMYRNVFFGEIVHDQVASLLDVNLIETTCLVLLALAILVLGVYPKPMIDLLHGSVGDIVQHALTTKLIA